MQGARPGIQCVHSMALWRIRTHTLGFYDNEPKFQGAMWFDPHGGRCWYRTFRWPAGSRPRPTQRVPNCFESDPWVKPRSLQRGKLSGPGMTPVHVNFTALELCFIRVQVAVAQRPNMLQELAHPQDSKACHHQCFSCRGLGPPLFSGRRWKFFLSNCQHVFSGFLSKLVLVVGEISTVRWAGWKVRLPHFSRKAGLGKVYESCLKNSHGERTSAPRCRLGSRLMLVLKHHFQRQLETESLMFLNCGAGEDSWESHGQWGDQTSPS